jgi:hypothetical protein
LVVQVNFNQDIRQQSVGQTLSAFFEGVPNGVYKIEGIETFDGDNVRFEQPNGDLCRFNIQENSQNDFCQVTIINLDGNLEEGLLIPGAAELLEKVNPYSFQFFNFSSNEPIKFANLSNIIQQKPVNNLTHLACFETASQNLNYNKINMSLSEIKCENIILFGIQKENTSNTSKLNIIKDFMMNNVSLYSVSNAIKNGIPEHIKYCIKHSYEYDYQEYLHSLLFLENKSDSCNKFFVAIQ